MKRELTKRFSKLLWFIFIIFTSFSGQLEAKSINGVINLDSVLDLALLSFRNINSVDNSVLPLLLNLHFKFIRF
jgi:hypothetical protein